MRRPFALLAAAALCVLSGAAGANPMLNAAAPNLFANGSVDTTINYLPSGLKERASAGQFSLLVTDLQTGASRTLQVFCTDIFKNLVLPTVYAVGYLSDTLTDTTKLLQINALLANGNSGVHNDISSAGLQLAIWEVQNETSARGYDLLNGNFFVTDTNNGALHAAASDLAKLASGEWQPNGHGVVRQLEAEGRQSLSYLEVPEPASLSLLGAGLITLGLYRRRSR